MSSTGKELILLIDGYGDGAAIVLMAVSYIWRWRMEMVASVHRLVFLSCSIAPMTKLPSQNVLHIVRSHQKLVWRRVQRGLCRTVGH
jgi:hypothetical protein